MPYYYLKLHHEILHDPKMGLLSDHLWRRVIELFTLASMRPERDGYLPSLEIMAWELHTSKDELLSELEEIEKSTDIVRKVVLDNWYVTNFNKRQASTDPTAPERMKRYRERNENENKNEDVTRNVTRNNSRKLRVESIDKNLDIKDNNTAAAVEVPAVDGVQGEIFRKFQNEICMLTPGLSAKVGDWIDDYPADWIKDAIDEAVKNNVRKVVYIDKILKNWQAEGRKNNKKAYIPEEHASEVY